MTPYEKAIQILQQTDLTSQTSRDNAIAEIKAQGLSIIETIKAVHKVGNIPLGQSKEFVALSPAFNEIARNNKPLHDMLIEAFNHPD